MTEQPSGSSAQSLSSASHIPTTPPPNEERALCGWAKHALDEGRAAEALSAWKAAGSPRNEDAAVSVAFALLEAEMGQWASVRTRAKRVADRTPDNLLAVGLAALGAYHEGAPREAADLFARHGLFAAFPLVRLFIRSFALDAMRVPGRFPPSFEQRTPPEATEGAETPADPPRPGLWRRFARGGGFGADSVSRAWAAEGDDWLRRDEPARALACYEAAGREDPRNWMARMAEALCRLENGDITRAADDLLALLGETPDVPNAAAAAAWACLHRGEPRRALDILSTLTAAGPDDWGMYYLSALAFLDAKKFDESDLMLREALGPFFLDTWENFVMPLFHRVVAGLRAEADPEGGRLA